MANKSLVLIFLDLTQVVTLSFWKRFFPLALRTTQSGTVQSPQSPPYCFLIINVLISVFLLISLWCWFLLFFPTSVRGLCPRISSLVKLSALVTSWSLIALNTVYMLETPNFKPLAWNPSTELWTHISNCLPGISLSPTTCDSS